MTDAFVGELRCMQCGRTAATARLWPDGLHLTPKGTADAESVRRMRCPWCLGNLRVEDTEGEAFISRRFTPDELVPRRRSPARKEVRG